MLARSHSFAVVGLDAVPVQIEVDAGPGLPGLTIVGLPDQAVKEARERVRSAILNSQFELPQQRMTVNLAPADLKKEGGLFDLPIALGILAASGQLDPAALEQIAAVGELALDGRLRPVPGVLPMALAGRARGARRLLVPALNAAEAGVADPAGVTAAETLRQAAESVADGPNEAARAPAPALPAFVANDYDVDFADVKGQALAKRALEIAAAGGHHVLLVGPPGSGKSMLAQRLPTIQPDLTLDDALETMRIHSVVGLLSPQQPLIRRRPFRAPHHTSSAAALVGGGSTPRPGEASLAHHGALFLDELPEFHRNVLESLRQPLEDGQVTVARAKRAVVFPARFTLIAAMNPCPCGYLTDPKRRCRCPSTKVSAYLSKVSGPLLDRIDLHVEVPAVTFEVITNAPTGESSAQIRSRVQQAQRYRTTRGQAGPNAHLRAKDLKTHCPMTPEGFKLLRTALQELQLSARSYTKILKIARTLADLAQQDILQPEHLAEAIQYRSLDRQWWG